MSCPPVHHAPLQLAWIGQEGASVGATVNDEAGATTVPWSGVAATVAIRRASVSMFHLFAFYTLQTIFKRSITCIKIVVSGHVNSYFNVDIMLLECAWLILRRVDGSDDQKIFTQAMNTHDNKRNGKFEWKVPSKFWDIKSFPGQKSKIRTTCS